MNLLFVGNYLSEITGSFSISEKIAEHLIAQGHRVIMISHHTNRFTRLLDMVFTTIKFRNLYDIAHIDIFSGPAFMWAEVICSLLNLLGKPVILTLHGGNLPKFAQDQPNRVERLLECAVVVTAPSQYLFQQMQSYCSKIIVIPNPIEISKFHFRKRLSPNPDLLWLRAFHKIYNPNLAVHVLAGLVNQFPSVNLSMVGRDKRDGSFQKVLEEARLLGVTNLLDLPGGISNNEVPSWVDKADILINTSNYDNTPVSIIEAMAGGMCVVSTNVGGIPYLLENELDAILVPPDAPNAMVAAVARIISESGLAEKLSTNARKKAEQFDWSVILPKWEKLFSDMIKKVES